MHSRTIPDPGFAGDDGAADPALAAALAAHPGTGGISAELGRAILAARLLVPVVAVLGESETGPDGLRRDKSADMALPTLVGRTGRRALPVFTSVQALADWRPDARPVPVTAQRAAAAAYAEDAEALLLDPAGPVTVVVEGADLVALAEGRTPLPLLTDPEVRAVVVQAVAELDTIVAAYLLEVPDADLQVALVPSRSAVPQRIRADVSRLGDRLAASELLRARLRRGMSVGLLPAGTDTAATAGGPEPVYRA